MTHARPVVLTFVHCVVGTGRHNRVVHPSVEVPGTIREKGVQMAFEVGDKVTWEPHPEWGESDKDAGIVARSLRGADGTTVIMQDGTRVHESRLTRG